MKLKWEITCSVKKTTDFSFNKYTEVTFGILKTLKNYENCRFKKQVRPGDQLRLEVEMTRVRGLIAKAHAIATIDDEIVCEADVTFALFDNKKA